MSAETCGRSPHFDVQRHDGTTAVGLADRVWPCYDEVFGDFDDFDTWRDDMFARHATGADTGSS